MTPVPLSLPKCWVVVESVTVTGDEMTALQLEDGWPLLQFVSVSQFPLADAIQVVVPPGQGLKAALALP